MKSKLVVGDHTVLGHTKVVEVWDEDKFIATVVGRDGRGVRVISKYPIEVIQGTDGTINIVEVIIGG